MFDLLNDLGVEGLAGLAGALLGVTFTWLVTRWRRLRERRRVLEGDARDTVVINLHLVDVEEGKTSEGKLTKRPAALRIRSLGHEQLDRVVPNGHLAAILLRRAWRVTAQDTLISMHDAEGSYLLETLTDFVCDRVANAPFDHDLYVMAPCCEPRDMAHHQPITIILVSVANLALFESWPVCRDIAVEHGSDGTRVLTLMELARRFKGERETIARLEREGKRTRFVETMYVLDLALDKRVRPLPTKKVPWGRFENVLRKLDLE
jgi:hypothetical protein